MTLVTICIPTYSARRLPYLREAIDSAVSQTHRELEVILSDNGHDPDVRAFALDEVRKDRRVWYRRNDPSLSLGGNFNAALQAANGQYVLFNGDDDRLLPTCIESLLSAHESDTVVAFSNHYIIDAAGVRDRTLTRQYASTYERENLPAGRVADPVTCAWRNSIPIPSALIRVAEAKRLGIRPELKACDLDLFVRLAADGGAFVFVPDFLSEYRVHGGSETSAGVPDMPLLRCLEPIGVPAHVEPLKRRIMSDTIVAAVSRALGAGDVLDARALMRNRYYPTIRERTAYVLAQRTLAALPSWVAGPSAAFAGRLRRRAR